MGQGRVASSITYNSRTVLNPNKKVIKLGSLRPTRDFNYVKDTCRGFLAIAESNRVKGETINIASQYEVSIGECRDYTRIDRNQKRSNN